MNGRATTLLLLTLAAASTVKADAPPPVLLPPPLPIMPECCIGPPVWTGIYAGVQAGGAFSNPHWTFPFVESFNTGTGQNFGTSASGTILGGHLGFNYQIRSLVLGAEVSFVSNGLNNHKIGPMSAFPTDSFIITSHDLFTAVARLGWAHGD
jgi:outer membrane immunogenic protein